eukprot:11134572-Ditylum_brightwellii.AAC.1
MDATMSLYKIESRLTDAASEIKHHISLFSVSSTASKHEKDQSLYHLKKTTLPYIESCPNKISSTAVSLSPIPCSKYVHNRNEREKKKNVWLVNKRKSTPLFRIENTLADNLPAAKCACTPPTCLSLCFGQKIPSSLKNALPPPVNGIQYTKKEIVGLLT